MEKEAVPNALKPPILKQTSANHAVIIAKNAMIKEHAHNVKHQPYLRTVNAKFVLKEAILSREVASPAVKTANNAIAPNSVLFAKNQP